MTTSISNPDLGVTVSIDTGVILIDGAGPDITVALPYDGAFPYGYDFDIAGNADNFVLFYSGEFGQRNGKLVSQSDPDQRGVSTIGGVAVAQFYGYDGVAIGDPIWISSGANGGTRPGLGTLSNGDYLAVWQVNDLPGWPELAGYLVGRTISHDGSDLGETFVIAAGVPLLQERVPPVVTEVGGEISVEWTSYTTTGLTSYSAQFSVTDVADGNAGLTNDVEVTTSITQEVVDTVFTNEVLGITVSIDQGVILIDGAGPDITVPLPYDGVFPYGYDFDIAGNSDGFVLFFSGEFGQRDGKLVSQSDPDQSGVNGIGGEAVAQFYGYDGVPRGDLLWVSSQGNGGTRPGLGALSNGDYLAVWQVNDLPGYPQLADRITYVVGRTISQDGSQLGETFVVAAGIPLFEEGVPPRITETNGEIIVSWSSYSAEFGVIDVSNVTSGESSDISNIVYGSDANDVLYTFEGSNTVYGLAGNDMLDTGANNDSLDGGSGADTLVGGDGNDTVTGGDGLDIVSAGAGDDLVLGDLGGDSLAGGEGVDTLTGGAGDDTADGGLGNDSLAGGEGLDTLSGGEGNDVVEGDLGNDSLTGGEGLDSLSGGEGNDVIAGDLGSDSVVGGEGADAVSGGLGDDSLDGGSGADTLAGGDGDDTVNAGSGNDVLVGGHGAGNDTYVGGLGRDTVKYTSAAAAITVDLASGRAQSTAGGDAAGIGTDRLVSVENIVGGRYGDKLIGGAGPNNLNGWLGADSLLGGAGSDVITGGQGDDTLVGGSGNDTLIGGDGADVFRFDGVKEQGGVDVIRSFNPLEDAIALDRDVFSALEPGAVLTPGAFVVGVRAADADDRILFDAQTGALFYDADGSGEGAAVQFATVTLAAGTLSSSDFLII